MLHYRLEGSGVPPLLLIHGWGVTYAIWEKLVPLLTPYFRLIMIELPGIGGSPEADPQKPYYQSCAEAINEVRETLGIEQWSLLAYSAGTRAAEAYVRRYPQTVTRVVFLCPVYLQEIWSLCLRLLAAPRAKTLHGWMLSDWRLYNAICALGFNWHRPDYTHAWQNEIQLQPVESLIRSLTEMPGKGRAPFDMPAVPTLFVWGSYDAITAKPRRLHPNDILILANHSAPLMAATEVAAAVLPFLTTGEIQPQVPNVTKERISLLFRSTASIPSIRTSSPYAVWRIWRKALSRQKKPSTRSKKEIRLMSRLRTNANKKLKEAREGRAKTKELHLLSRRKKKVRSTTHPKRKRFFLNHSSDNQNSTGRERRLFFRRSYRQGDRKGSPLRDI